MLRLKGRSTTMVNYSVVDGRTVLDSREVEEAPTGSLRLFGNKSRHSFGYLSTPYRATCQGLYGLTANRIPISPTILYNLP